MEGLESQSKEWLSHAYLHMISAAAGYPIDFPSTDVVGVDATVRDEGVSVDFQLKATSIPKIVGDVLKYDLDIRTYDLLRGPVRTALAYLVVVVIQEDMDERIDHSDDGPRILGRGYWRDMTGLPPTANKWTVRIDLPLANTLDVASVQAIMADARRQVTP